MVWDSILANVQSATIVVNAIFAMAQADINYRKILSMNNLSYMRIICKK